MTAAGWDRSPLRAGRGQTVIPTPSVLVKPALMFDLQALTDRRPVALSILPGIDD